jgi:uncharacterized protein (TIGR02421 family)
MPHQAAATAPGTDAPHPPPPPLATPTEITEAMIGAIVKRVETGKRVRRSLPLGGILHLDRQVPFLLVYRRPARRRDPFIEHLFRGEAAYLIADGQRRFHRGLAALTSAVATTLADSFGAFLIIEIWPSKDADFDSVVPSFRPAFKILTQDDGPSLSCAHTLKQALGRIKVQGAEALVNVTETGRPWLPGNGRLVAAPLARRIGCYQLGIAVRPVYHDPAAGDQFPLIQRLLQRGFGRSVRRTVFAFTRDQTTQRPPHFHALGPRSLVKLVWKVDRELAEIAEGFDFLLCVTPTNAERAWNWFKQRRFAARPSLAYRPLPVDPALVKRRLYRIPIEKIEDPALEALFRAQQMELDRKLTMLGDRGTARFLYGSLQVYGRVDPELLRTAEDLLLALPEPRRHRAAAGTLDAEAFAERAREEIDYYRAQGGKLRSRVEIRDDVLGVMVSHGDLLVNRRFTIPEDRIGALLAHEVGTHILTYFNGRAQPFRQLYGGLPGYEELQEGLAVLSEYLSGGLTASRMRTLAARVVAAEMVTAGAGFVEVVAKLSGDYGFSHKAGFTIALRVFRGGGLLKDMIYLRGLKRLMEYLSKGGDFEPLFIGKLGTDHLGIINELRWRKVLRAPAFLPRYSEDPRVAARLEAIRGGLDIKNLIQRGSSCASVS